MNPLTQQLNTSAPAKLLTDRVALVTGASRGIGAAIAKLLAQHGAAVGVNFFENLAAAQSVVEAIEAAGGKAIPVKADIRNESQVKDMVRTVFETFGSIDTLVLNGSGSFTVAPFLEYSWTDFEAKVLSELKAAFFACKEVAPMMVEQRFGSIIAVSTGFSRTRSAGFVAHSTAKPGLDAFVKSLALELGTYGIRVNAVAPGLIETDATAFLPQAHKEQVVQITPLHRTGMPEDIAKAILMLASDLSQFITGNYLPLNGGLQML